MAKKKNEKRHINVIEDCDTDRLYGGVDDAIKYLSEMRDKFKQYSDFGLYEHWTGYEDMQMVFSYTRLETDEEFSSRLADEERARRYAEDARKREEKRAKDLAEYNRLRKQLGIQH